MRISLEPCCEVQYSARDIGRAKVCTMRGKFKQCFLRLPTEGERDCKTANLKVSPERTLEVFIEDVCQRPPRLSVLS